VSVSDRIGEIHRVTGETDVRVALNLDGSGRCQVATGVPFLDHMLHQLASHGLLDLEITASGDTHIDDHHSNEDVGIAVGQALAQALGDRRGIQRFGHFVAPLDEALVQVALEACFKAFARALRLAVEIDPRRAGSVPSSKGVLERAGA